ncbi:unnamed protein product [Thelazia callipaeda]|uniref:ATP synthase subunit d, mitochondrial n=1 Tax=Thelazia callipaeda TaxID=103827 RepID=A0A0N5CLV8_THECL|nr:unnamed protein product [Thelazia callipaeda]
MAFKRFTQSIINFKKVADLVGEKHAKEVTALAHHHHQYWSVVMSKLAELPKYDFAKLKEQMPEHRAVLNNLQKQYEALKVPFGTVPERLTQEIDQFLKYINAKMDFLSRKLLDAVEDEKKVKAKYENMPPIEHFRQEHFAKFFPEVHRDVRLPIERFTMAWGTSSTPEHFQELKKLYRDYRTRPAPEHHGK